MPTDPDLTLTTDALTQVGGGGGGQYRGPSNWWITGPGRTSILYFKLLRTTGFEVPVCYYL